MNRIYRNWRIDTLLLLIAIAAVLLLSEADSLGLLVAAKAAGLTLAYIIYRLGRFWNGKGKINELMELED